MNNEKLISFINYCHNKNLSQYEISKFHNVAFSEEIRNNRPKTKWDYYYKLFSTNNETKNTL